MFKNTNYNLKDLGYSMPKKYSQVFTAGIVCVVLSLYYGTGHRYFEASNIFTLEFWVYLGFVSTITAGILAAKAGAEFYRRNGQFRSYLFLFIAVMLGLCSCV